jgi:hypothetical protein
MAANLSAHTAVVNRRLLHVSLTVVESRFETEELRLPLMKKKKAANRDGLCIMRLGVFGIGTSIHQVPFLHSHPNGR